MKVTLFGATGDIGRHVLDRLLEGGHRVTVVARSPEGLPADVAGRIRVVHGELSDAATISRAVAGANAVIWAVGPTSNTPDQPAIFAAGAAALVRAMERHGVSRLIALSGAGVTMPGERKPVAGRLISWLVARIVRHVVAAKERERDIFTASSLAWTLVRPPRVVKGEARGTPALTERLRVSRVTEGDVAAAMVSLLGRGGRAHVRAAPYVG